MNYSTSQPFLLTAAWVLPVATPPLRGGGLILSEGKIERVLSRVEVEAFLDQNKPISADSKRPQVHHEHLPGCIITPGLFNLHTHLDYSNLAHLSNFNGETMFDWLEGLVAESRSQLGTPETLIRSAHSGAEELALAGTTYVVDSTFMGAAATGLAQVGLKGLVGLELFGLDEDRAEMLFDMWKERLAKLLATAGSALTESIRAGRIRMTVAPHAPYTVSPALWARARDWAAEHGLPLTCHLAESDNEANWIAAVDTRLENYLLKVMPPNPDRDMTQFLKNLPWRGGGRSPSAHLEHYGLLNNKTISAHCLKTSAADLALLAQYDVKVALCPRSNVILKNGLPQPGHFLDAGLTVGLGSDSKASSPSLNMLEEARYLSQNLGSAPSYERLLKMLTLDSAKAVGLEETTGSLVAGKCGDIAVFEIASGEENSDDIALVSEDKISAALFENHARCRLLFVDGRPVVSDARLI